MCQRYNLFINTQNLWKFQKSLNSYGVIKYIHNYYFFSKEIESSI